ncbi:hypothetical protein DERP_006840 [Dermatophagoides pteronyssinus]|uniref:Uncharacterized protein n=1 Tax=Dermatophagoides pteronyssinus TaxID=6956 RepID=A0ABQ8IS89_DERPT|nr:hypothetical protein DERP_006840 [Dermatophagoides pteronyssinus]
MVSHPIDGLQQTLWTNEHDNLNSNWLRHVVVTIIVNHIDVEVRQPILHQVQSGYASELSLLSPFIVWLNNVFGLVSLILSLESVRLH